MIKRSDGAIYSRYDGIEELFQEDEEKKKEIRSQ